MIVGAALEGQQLADFTIFGMNASNLSVLFLSSYFLAYALDWIMERLSLGIWLNMLVINLVCPFGFVMSRHYFGSDLINIEHMVVAIATTTFTILVISYVRIFFFLR